MFAEVRGVYVERMAATIVFAEDTRVLLTNLCNKEGKFAGALSSTIAKVQLVSIAVEE